MNGKYKLAAICLMMMALAESAFGVSPSVTNVQAGQKQVYKRPILVTSAVGAQADAVVPLTIHHSEGTSTGSDIYMPECRTDFGDVRFEDEAGNPLSYYQVSRGNWSVETDASLGYSQYIVTADVGGLHMGDIICSSPAGNNGVYISSDNGATWTQLVSYGGTRVLGVDNGGNIYISYQDHGLYRGVWNSSAWTFTCVVDTHLLAAGNGFQPYGFAVSAYAGTLGYIYAGQYNYPGEPLKIYVSRDNGATWAECQGSAGNGHVHGLSVDPYTGKIYVGIDSQTLRDRRMLQGTDNGSTVTWSNTLLDPTYASVTDMLFTSTQIIVGADPGGERLGQCVMSILKSDIANPPCTPTILLRYPGTCQGLVQVGNTIFCLIQNYKENKYNLILASTNTGVTWQTVWTSEPETRDDFIGPAYPSNVGAPVGQPLQGILGYSDFFAYPSLYPPMRLFAEGDKWQAMYQVRLPTLPSGGATIYAVCDGVSASWHSDVTAAIEPTGTQLSDNLVARWSFDAGNGADDSGHGFTALPVGTGQTFPATDGWRSGPIHPAIVQSGSCLDNTASGYMRVTCASDDALDLTENFTMIGWVRTLPTSPPAYQVFFGRGSHSDKAQYVLYISDGETPVLSFLHNDYTYPGEDDFYPANGTWTQIGVIVGAKSGSPGSEVQTIRMLMNGQLGAEVTLAAGGITSTTCRKFAIGAVGYDDDTIMRPFIGQIDEVCVWNRELTAAEVRALYERHWPVTVDGNAPSYAPGKAKTLSDGASIRVGNAIVVAVPALTGDGYYIESTDRGSGIRVRTGETLSIGDKIGLIGTVKASGTEKAVDAFDVSVVSSGNTLPKPLDTSPRWLFKTPDSLGKIVKMWGMLGAIDPSSPAKWFILKDPSGINVKCALGDGVTIDPAWTMISVIGVSSCESVGGRLKPVMLVSQSSDIKNLLGP